jgi:putative transposase
VSEYTHKSHNVTVLIYHLVFPAQYKCVVFDDDVEEVLKEICLDIEMRYQVKFLEIWIEKDHVHFLVQSVPTYNVTKIATMLKSLTAREMFRRFPQVKKKTCGGVFCTDGYFASTVGKHLNESIFEGFQQRGKNRFVNLRGALFQPQHQTIDCRLRAWYLDYQAKIQRDLAQRIPPFRVDYVVGQH